ncbi:MAG: DUF368 domain-containing protein [Oscillospiraceae bacterium]|nr:DUF368 domain-containing protein [Oscillospiraceae bacterium]
MGVNVHQTFIDVWGVLLYNSANQKRTDEQMKNFFYRVFCGFFLGLSVLAPGVSGSIMAVMMGIYEDLLTIISNPFKNFKRNLGWIIPLGLGAGLSALLFIALFSQLFDTYPLATYLLFLGLVVGNLPAVFGDAKQNGMKKSYALPMAFAFALALGLGALRAYLNASGSDFAAPDALWYLALAGLVGGISSMVPGISISMVLMLLGVYNRLLDAARGSVDEALTFIGVRTGDTAFTNILMAGVTAVCFLAGMIAFSHVTKSVLTRHKAPAYWTVFAFMCGSVGAIAVNLPIHDGNFAWWQAAIALPVGLLIALSFVLIGRRMRKNNALAEDIED